jgi:peptidyl-prolyl cis-trans isomerase C
MLKQVVALLAVAVLGACGQKAGEATPGQALASVNGVEITVLQLNDELARAGVKAANEQAAGKQLLQALIDRQLLQGEAAREKLDRDPKVMQAIDRARALIVAQAWLQKRIGNLAPPTAAEIEAYYHAHPQFFSTRKQFSMDQLQLPAAALTPPLKAVVDSATSLDAVTGWLAANKVQAGRSHVVRSTSDLAPGLATRLLAMRKGQVFAVQEGERALVIALADVQDAPVTLAAARPQIEQFLMKQRQKELASTELARLRADARIEYLNKDFAMDPAAPAPARQAVASTVPAAPANGVQPRADASASATASATANTAADAALDRGVAGLK